MSKTVCPSCASANVWTNPGYEETLVAVVKITDDRGEPDHDDNCKMKGYWCADCAFRWRLVLKNRCPNERCTWVGKSECRSCGYDSSAQVDVFPLAQEKQ